MAAWWLGLILAVIGLVGLFMILGVTPRTRKQEARPQTGIPITYGQCEEIGGTRVAATLSARRRAVRRTL